MPKGQQAISSCAKPVLIRVEAQASHGFRPLDPRIAELADIWALAGKHAGMAVKPVVVQ